MYNVRSTSPFGGVSSSIESSTRNKTQSVIRLSTIPQSIFVKREILPCSTWSASSNIDDNDAVIKRSFSNGYHFLRKRSAEEQEEISRARAQQMSSMYELSDIKSSDLRKSACFKRAIVCAPSLSADFTVKQAAAAFNQKKVNKNQLIKLDPLLTEHERNRQLHKQELARNKVDVDTLLSPSGQLSRPPFAHVNQPRSSSSAFSKQQLPAESCHRKKVWSIDTFGHNKNKGCSIDTSTKVSSAMGMEVYPATPGHFSVEDTVIETPSPIGFRASNGQVYEVPNLC